MPRLARKPADTPAFYIGIDPGKKGAIAIIRREGSTSSMEVWEISDDLVDLYNAFSSLVDLISGNPYVGVLERVQGFIGRKQPGSSMFVFGHTYGMIKMAAYATGLRNLNLVMPHVWQAHLELTPRDKEKEKRYKFKTRLYQTAVEMFPSVKLKKTTADAALIAEYCQRVHEAV